VTRKALEQTRKRRRDYRDQVWGAMVVVVGELRDFSAA
jgi:hypothetical protein